MDACWAFRSTSGSLFLSPDIRPLEITLEADELVDILDLDRGVARDHDARLDILGDHAAGADERAGTDAQPREDGRVGADAHVVLDGRAQHALEVARADGVGVVGEDDVRGEEDAAAQRHVLEEAPAVDARAVADPVARLEHRVGADAAVVSDDVVFADQRAVAAVEPVADDRARVDDRAGADHASGADDCLQLARLLPARRLADDRALVHDSALADVDVGEDQARPARAPAARRSSPCACSSTRTTATPSRADVSGSLPLRTQSTKCSSCSRSGSRCSRRGTPTAPPRTAATKSAEPPS